MSFDFGENFDMANMLHRHAEIFHNDIGFTEEVCFRSAISRAYYSCFNQAKHLALNDPPRLSRFHNPNHQQIWQHLESDQNITKRNIGRLGDSLRRSRHDADYHDYKSTQAEEARLAIENAENILSLLSGLGG